MIGLDTCAVIDLFKGDEKLKKVLETYNEPASITILTYLELMFGIDESRKDHKKEEFYYDEFAKSVSTLPLSRDAAKKGSKIFHVLQSKGHTLGKFDCCIAAIFLTSGVTKIITKNKKHFGSIPNIIVIDY